jgi:hypothetical protein
MRMRPLTARALLHTGYKLEDRLPRDPITPFQGLRPGWIYSWGVAPGCIIGAFQARIVSWPFA